MNTKEVDKVLRELDDVINRLGKAIDDDDEAGEKIEKAEEAECDAAKEKVCVKDLFTSFAEVCAKKCVDKADSIIMCLAASDMLVDAVIALRRKGKVEKIDESKED